jgi:hypothetical protein
MPKTILHASLMFESMAVVAFQCAFLFENASK